MTPEDKSLFILIRQDLLETHERVILDTVQNTGINWEILLKTAEDHGVVPLIYANLSKSNRLTEIVPTELLEKYRLYAYRATIEKEKHHQTLEEGLSYLSTKAIPAMLIKGTALEFSVYDFPWYTVSGDIDIILKCRKDELNAKDLKEIMDFFHLKGIEYDFYRHHDVDMNGTLPVDFDQVWADAHPVQFRGQPVFIMSPEDRLITLCINSCRKRYFRLKSLFDIGETARQDEDINWSKVLQRARSFDCQRIIYTALRVSENTVGFSWPEGLALNLEPSGFRRKTIDAIIQFLIRNSTLGDYPFSGKFIQGRQINLALLLTYASYRGYQSRHKLQNIFWPEDRKN